MQYRNYLMAILMLCTLLSCEKGDTPSKTKYEVTFNKDGVTETFTPYACSIQPNRTMPGKTDFMLMAQSSDHKNHLGITIQVDGEFKPGRYESGGSDNYMIADYFQNTGAPTERDFTIDHAPSKANSAFVVTVTAVTKSEMSGSFSGNYLYDRVHDESVVITEGRFIVKRH